MLASRPYPTRYKFDQLLVQQNTWQNPNLWPEEGCLKGQALCRYLSGLGGFHLCRTTKKVKSIATIVLTELRHVILIVQHWWSSVYTVPFMQMDSKGVHKTVVVYTRLHPAQACRSLRSGDLQLSKQHTAVPSSSQEKTFWGWGWSSSSNPSCINPRECLARHIAKCQLHKGSYLLAHLSSHLTCVLALKHSQVATSLQMTKERDVGSSEQISHGKMAFYFKRLT